MERTGEPVVFRTELEVRSYELDSFRHANHAVFLNYLEQARFEALRAGGFSYSDIQTRGWGIHVVRMEIDYTAELKLGDAFMIETWIHAYRRTSMVLAQRITRHRPGHPDTVASESRVTVVWIGENGRPMRVPAEARAALGEPSDGPSRPAP